jgi:hypothetical protein
MTLSTVKRWLMAQVRWLCGDDKLVHGAKNNNFRLSNPTLHQILANWSTDLMPCLGLVDEFGQNNAQVSLTECIHLDYNR